MEKSTPTCHCNLEDAIDKVLSIAPNEATQPIRTSNNKSGLGNARPVTVGSFLGPNDKWHTAVLLISRYPLVNHTNDSNKHVRISKEAPNYSRNTSKERSKGVLDDLSYRAQPTEPALRYAKPSFIRKPNN